MSPGEIIERLGMRPHPEGGHYVETFRADAPTGERPSSTAIFFLLQAGERSHWHRIDAVEIWHFYAGAPLELSIADDGGVNQIVLGADLKSGETPQAVVPVGTWQAAQSLGAWTLVGCTVAPGFEFAGFELAAPDWSPFE